MTDDPLTNNGTAGRSAQAEYDRRKANREAPIRTAHPRVGGFLLAATGEPQTTRAWAIGAAGERRVAARLAELAGDEVALLHDRRIPGSRANIDHIAIGPAGVYVIDAKHYSDAKVEVRRSGGLFRPVTEQLFVRGRDQTKLVAGLAPQVAAVVRALADAPPDSDVTVRSLLCFVDALLPLRGSLSVGGVPVLGPRGTAKLIRTTGPLTARRRAVLQVHLAARLPAA